MTKDTDSDPAASLGSMDAHKGVDAGVEGARRTFLGEREKMKDAANEMLAKGIAEIVRIAAEPDWIPVTERMPVGYETVLVTDGSSTLVARVTDDRVGRVWRGEGFRRPTSEITHWMPLPTPPTDAK